MGWITASQSLRPNNDLVLGMNLGQGPSLVCRRVETVSRRELFTLSKSYEWVTRIFCHHETRTVTRPLVRWGEVAL